MRPISHARCLLSILGAPLVAACSDSTALPPAQFENVVDTTQLAAITGTPIGEPSAFDGVAAITARTDLNDPFDFAIDMDAAGTVLLLPAGAIGPPEDPGLLIVDRAFDNVVTAPTDGYVQDSALTAGVGTVFVLRSRLSTQLCTASGALPRYSKFEVLAIDAQRRSVTFKFLANLNCGYRGLEPGTPAS